ncbi:MAG: FHA domain-containing protein [Lentisphaeria bacterium]|nr:FHA domain-containing protein [Lentisphaeria bacterium]
MSILNSLSSAVENRRKELHIGIEHNGILLYEVYTEEFTKEISIGRSSQCDWSLSQVDESVSSKHALISLRKDSFYLTDLGSRNGMYFQAKRIAEKKLVPGDRISLGECVVFVDDESKKLKKLSQMNQIEYVNGSGRKVLYDISKPETIIGSASDADIRIEDQLISSRHAVISLRNDGSCWLKDNGSRNGTSVNGKELPVGSERMLQEGDIITIAYLEMKFLDAAVLHESSKLLTSIVIAGITILVVLGGYIGYMQLTPSADAIIAAARREAAQLDFSAAEKLLNDSKLARNADDAASERETLFRQIAIWKKTIHIWEMVKKDLVRKQFNTANSNLSSINHSDLNTWNWNNDAAFVEKSKAQAVKQILDCCSGADSLLKQENELIARIEKQKMELSFAMRSGEQYKNEKYMQSLLQEGSRQLQRLDRVMQEHRYLNNIISLLSHEKPDYQRVMTDLTKLAETGQEAVQIKAKRILIPVRNLARETNRMLEAVSKVCELDFAAVESFSLNLPDSVDYSSEKNIASLKQALINRVKRLKDSSIQISILYRNLKAQGVATGKKVAAVEHFLSDETMKQVYSFDIFNYTIPRISRREPSGVYDQMVGYEFMYDYLKNIHADMMTLNIEDLPFKPQLYLVRTIFTDINRFLTYVDRDENLWFQNGKLNTFIEHCRTIPALREKIISRCRKQFSVKDKRTQLLAKGIVLYLSSINGSSKEENEKFANEFQTLTRAIQKKDREFSRSMPEEQIKLRDEIIAAGFPGDPIVRKMWRMRPTEKRRK